MSGYELCLLALFCICCVYAILCLWLYCVSGWSVSGYAVCLEKYMLICAVCLVFVFEFVLIVRICGVCLIYVLFLCVLYCCLTFGMFWTCLFVWDKKVLYNSRGKRRLERNGGGNYRIVKNLDKLLQVSFNCHLQKS